MRGAHTSERPSSRSQSWRYHDSSNMSSESDPMVLRFTRERDAHCPRCGYNARNTTRAVCTECGAALVLRVGIGTPKIGLLIACLMPMIAYCGVAIWVWVPVGLSILFPRIRSGIPLVAYGLALLVLIEAVVILRIYRARMWFLALSRLWQVALVALVWLFHAGITAGFLLGPP